MNNEAKKFMSEAIRLASQNIKIKNGGPFGAVVVKDGKIIATGFNEVVHNNDPTAHAEILAIRKACEVLGTYQLTGCEIYSSCEPCPMCLGAIYWARPDKVYFAASRHDAGRAGFDDDYIYEELYLQPDQRMLPTEQIMQAEGSALFDRWIELDPDIKY
jgi:guanine deaminase